MSRHGPRQERRGVPRTIEHFEKAGFRGIKGNIVYALIIQVVFIHQNHHGLTGGITNAFEKSKLSGHRAQITNGLERILQVVQEAKTKHQGELTEFEESRVFDIHHFKADMRITTACLQHVFFASVEAENMESKRAENIRKIAHTTTDVHGSSQRKDSLELRDEIPNDSFPRHIQLFICFLVKSPVAFQVPSLSSKRLKKMKVCSARHSTHRANADGFERR